MSADGRSKIFVLKSLCISHLGTPGQGTPGLGTPGLGTPGLGTPSLATPGLSTPCLATHDLGTPGLATPGLVNPRLDDTLGPGTVDSCLCVMQRPKNCFPFLSSFSSIFFKRIGIKASFNPNPVRLGPLWPQPP